MDSDFHSTKIDQKKVISSTWSRILPYTAFSLLNIEGQIHSSKTVAGFLCFCATLGQLSTIYPIKDLQNFDQASGHNLFIQTIQTSLSTDSLLTSYIQVVLVLYFLFVCLKYSLLAYWLNRTGAGQLSDQSSRTILQFLSTTTAF